MADGPRRAHVPRVRLLQSVIDCLLCAYLRRVIDSTHSRHSRFSPFSINPTLLFPCQTEPDGRMFPVSDSSQSVIDCLLSQAQQLSGTLSVTISPGWPVASITRTPAGQSLISSSKQTPTLINISLSPPPPLSSLPPSDHLPGLACIIHRSHFCKPVPADPRSHPPSLDPLFPILRFSSHLLFPPPVTISPGWPVASIARTPAGQFLITSSKKAPPIINSSSPPSSSSSSPLSLMADFVLIGTGGSIKQVFLPSLRSCQHPFLCSPHRSSLTLITPHNSSTSPHTLPSSSPFLNPPHPSSPLFTPPHLFPPLSTPGAFHGSISRSLHHPSLPFHPSSPKSISQFHPISPLPTRPRPPSPLRISPHPSLLLQGHDMASSLGHSIIPPCPSLFTFNIPDSALTALAGVSLEDVSLKLLRPSCAETLCLGCQEPARLCLHWWVGALLVAVVGAWASFPFTPGASLSSHLSSRTGE
ncbi:unnamed protein product [Closterium sp. NIES-65]|nr:unnamed protein product [Closterium sp. NIES-65]